MELVVEILAPGFDLEPWAGSGTTFEKAQFENPAGERVPGFRALLSARFAGRSIELAADRAVVVAQALLDVLLRWPLAEPQILVTVDGTRVGRPRDISRLQLYEIGEILAGGLALPRSVLSVSSEVPPRIELLWSLAMSLPVTPLDRLLGPLSQASAGASARHPFDRVSRLWSVLELLYPSPSGDLRRIDTIVSTDPLFAAVEAPRGLAVLGALLAYRGRLARDSWLRASVRSRLASPPRTRADRVLVATALAYAVRCKIVHGQWARFSDDHRLEAVAAEKWLWQLVEREVELRITGRRLPAIKAVSSTKVGA